MLLPYYYLQLGGFLSFAVIAVCTSERQLESDFFGSLNTCAASTHKWEKITNGEFGGHNATDSFHVLLVNHCQQSSNVFFLFLPGHWKDPTFLRKKKTLMSVLNSKRKTCDAYRCGILRKWFPGKFVVCKGKCEFEQWRCPSVSDVRRQTQSRRAAVAVGRDDSRRNWKVHSWAKDASL